MRERSEPPLCLEMIGPAGAFAELEREIIRERVKAGMASARKRGKHLGRPATPVDPALVLGLLREGLCRRAIAKRLGVSEAKVRRVLAGCDEGSPKTVPLSRANPGLFRSSPDATKGVAFDARTGQSVIMANPWFVRCQKTRIRSLRGRMAAEVMKMDVAAFGSAIAIGNQGLDLARKAIDLIPRGAKKDSATRAIEEAADALRISEAKAARELGFLVCPCSWPPLVMTFVRERKVWECRGCGHEYTPPQPQRHVIRSSWMSR